MKGARIKKGKYSKAAAGASRGAEGRGDAVQEGVLDNLADYSVFRLKGKLHKSAKSNLIDEVLDALALPASAPALPPADSPACPRPASLVAPPEHAGADKGGSGAGGGQEAEAGEGVAAEAEEQAVVLSRWAIKLVESKTVGDRELRDKRMWVVLLGIIKGTENIAQSSFIRKRVDARCVMSKSTKYVLEGDFDEAFVPHPLFSSDSARKFKSGFPFYWKAIINGEVKKILRQQLEREEPAEVGGSGDREPPEKRERPSLWEDQETLLEDAANDFRGPESSAELTSQESARLSSSPEPGKRRPRKRGRKRMSHIPDSRSAGGAENIYAGNLDLGSARRARKPGQAKRPV